MMAAYYNEFDLGAAAWLREIDASAHELRTDHKMASQTRARMLRAQRQIMTAILAGKGRA